MLTYARIIGHTEAAVTQLDTTTAPPTGAAKPRYRGRHLPMVAVVVAAFIATALAYSGMVLFGLEVAGMSPAEAYALAGFLEVSLVAVALMARNAALEARPYGVLLTLTWILSGTSGLFAALHEIAVPSESTPYMVVFRFIPPLVAALMWHLALVGERHLVTGDTLDERRREHRVHQYVTALEEWRDARLDSTGDRRSTRKVRTAHESQRAARDRALKLLTVEDFEHRMEVWVERLEAAERHGNRLDTIGASSVKRGTTPGVMEAVAPAQPVEDAPVSETATTEQFDDVSIVELMEEDTTADDAVGPAQDSADPAPVDERLPETGHTRRVEIFDLVNRPAWATRGATPQPDAASQSGVARTSDEGTVPDDEPASERDRRIVALAAAGMAHREIADEVDASRSTVGRVVRRYGVPGGATVPSPADRQLSRV